MQSNQKNQFTIYHYTECLDGGVLRAISTLANIQVESTETHVIYIDRKENNSNQHYERYFSPKVKLRSLGGSSLSGLLTLFWSIMKLPNQRETCIHLHSSWAGVVGRIACVFMSKLTVFYSPHCFAFQRKDLNSIWINFFFLCEKLLAKINRVVILPLNQMELNFANELGAKNARLFPNFVEVPVASTSKVNSQVNFFETRILTVGRLCEQKRPDRFSDVASFFLNDKRFTFTWVGDGDARYKKAFPKNVTVTGWLNEDSVQSNFRNADIFLMLSDWEGMPFAVLDALANGVPVIAWSFPGATDLIEDGITGFVVNTLSGAIQAIQNLHSNPQTKGSMVAASRTYASNYLNVNILKQEWKNLYGL